MATFENEESKVKDFDDLESISAGSVTYDDARYTYDDILVMYDGFVNNGFLDVNSTDSNFIDLELV